MLILVQKGEYQGGFFLKRKAKKGKLPPMVVGIRVGKYPCVLLNMYGDITPGNAHLAPYLGRGDVVIPHKGLEKLGFHLPYVQEFTRRQCVNTAKGWVATAPKEFQSVLWDATGECVGVAAELCALKRPVWVVTRKAESYAPCAEYALLTFGNSPVIGKSIPQTAHLVIAPYGIPSVKLQRDIPVVAPGHIWATHEQHTLPKEILETTPSGFDPVAVAAGCMAAFGGCMELKARLSL